MTAGHMMSYFLVGIINGRPLTLAGVSTVGFKGFVIPECLERHFV